MAPVKIKFIVSFSSQDSTQKANNLLGDDHKRWLIDANDRSGQLEAVFQLDRPCRLAFVDIGVIWCANVEIRVGQSDWPRDQDYVTLVPPQILMTAMDCHLKRNIQRTCMFSKDDFSPEGASGEWDRVQVVCRQPWRKDVQLGVSFLRMRSADSTQAMALNPSSTVTASVAKPLGSRNSVADIQKHFFGNKTDSNEADNELKKRLQRMVATTEGGSDDPVALPRIAHMVLSANRKCPPSGPPDRLDNNPRLFSGAVEKRQTPELHEEVDKFLHKQKIGKKDIDSLKVSDLRHKFEKQKWRKLNIDEKQTFYNCCETFIGRLFDEEIDTNRTLAMDNPVRKRPRSTAPSTGKDSLCNSMPPSGTSYQKYWAKQQITPSQDEGPTSKRLCVVSDTNDQNPSGGFLKTKFGNASEPPRNGLARERASRNPVKSSHNSGKGKMGASVRKSLFHGEDDASDSSLPGQPGPSSSKNHANFSKRAQMMSLSPGKCAREGSSSMKGKSGTVNPQQDDDNPKTDESLQETWENFAHLQAWMRSGSAKVKKRLSSSGQIKTSKPSASATSSSLQDISGIRNMCSTDPIRTFLSPPPSSSGQKNTSKPSASATSSSSLQDISGIRNLCSTDPVRTFLSPPSCRTATSGRDTPAEGAGSPHVGNHNGLPLGLSTTPTPIKRKKASGRPSSCVSSPENDSSGWLNASRRKPTNSESNNACRSCNKDTNCNCPQGNKDACGSRRHGNRDTSGDRRHGNRDSMGERSQGSRNSRGPSAKFRRDGNYGSVDSPSPSTSTGHHRKQARERYPEQHSSGARSPGPRRLEMLTTTSITSFPESNNGRITPDSDDFFADELLINDDDIFVECPLCHKMFPSDVVNIHASDCMGEVSDNAVGVTVLTDSLVPCPLCNNMFRPEVIQEHASACCSSLNLKI